MMLTNTTITNWPRLGVQPSSSERGFKTLTKIVKPREKFLQRGKNKLAARADYIQAVEEKIGDATGVATSTTASMKLQDATEVAKAEQDFVWTKNWYPVAVLCDLDPSAPHAVTLLGRNLVLWRDVSQTWRCFEDFCPHRLAPLSEGRIEPSDGTLQCSYHGWRYDGTGHCTKIPQAANEKGEATALASGRSHAKTFPCRAEDGMVRVWPDTEPSAYLDAEVTAIPVEKDIMAKVFNVGFKGPYLRELPYGYNFLVENLVDPAHVPVSHHGIFSLNRDMAGSIAMNVTQTGLTGDSHVIKAIDTTIDQSKNFDSQIVFKPPTHVRYQWSSAKGTGHQLLWAVPVGPGRSKCFVMDLFEPVRAPPAPAAALIRTLLPKVSWILHMIYNQLFDGDNVFLHKQERRLMEVQGGDWKKSYYLPAGADGLVVAARKWLDLRAGGGPTWAPGTPPGLPPSGTRREQLDRFEQHTKHCSACKNALTNIHRAQTGVVGGGAVAALSLVFAFAKGLPLLSPLPLTAITCAVLCIAASSGLRGIKEKLTFADFRHSDN